MDTDDLTEMAYGSIIIANGITGFLKCDLGVRSKDYEDENAYLNGILKFIRRIKNDPEDYLDYWDLMGELELDSFEKGIEELEKYIIKTIETPMMPPNLFSNFQHLTLHIIYIRFYTKGCNHDGVINNTPNRVASGVKYGKSICLQQLCYRRFFLQP